MENTTTRREHKLTYIFNDQLQDMPKVAKYKIAMYLKVIV